MFQHLTKLKKHSCKYSRPYISQGRLGTNEGWVWKKVDEGKNQEELSAYLHLLPGAYLPFLGGQQR